MSSSTRLSVQIAEQTDKRAARDFSKCQQVISLCNDARLQRLDESLLLNPLPTRLGSLTISRHGASRLPL